MKEHVQELERNLRLLLQMARHAATPAAFHALLSGAAALELRLQDCRRSLAIIEDFDRRIQMAHESADSTDTDG